MSRNQPYRQGRRTRSARPKSVSRRGFIHGAAALGVTATIPPWLGGCLPAWFNLPEGGETADRELRTLHFDLSHVDPQAEYTLHVVRSSRNGAALVRHTDETRALCRADNSLLQQIPDEQLTHFVEDVDFPSDAIQQWWVTTTSPNGPPAVVTTHIHVPQQASNSLAKRRRQKVLSGRVAQSSTRPPTSSSKHFGVKATPERSAEAMLGDLNTINTPLDAATSVVFHHPEIMNLNPTDAANVLDVIQNLEGDTSSCVGDQVGMLTALACAIAAQGPAGTDSGWIRVVPAATPDGAPVISSTGEQIYDYRLSDATLQAADPVVKAVLREVFNDPDIKGNRFAESPAQPAPARGTRSKRPAGTWPPTTTALPAPSPTKPTASARISTD